VDRDRFDSLTRVLATTPSRRAALGALLAASVAAVPGLTDARNKKSKNRKKDRKNARKKTPAVAAPAVEASISAEAVVCQPPRHSANLSGCNYNNDDLSGADLSSSRMVGTSFRGTNLCGADLSSSQLKNADFRGFAAGNVTNLTNADLHSSGCAGILTNSRTIFCNTIGCDGEVINPDCAATCACTPTTCAEEGVECGVIPDGCGETLTCGPCSAPEVCCLGSGLTCATSGTCNACLDTCPDRCGVCNLLADGSTLCGSGAGSGTSCSPCTSDDECAGEQRCILGWIFRENSQTNTISQICNVSLPVGGCVALNRCV
jgi:hypothetical protein